MSTNPETLPPLPEGKAVVRGPVSAFRDPESGTLVDFDCEGPLSHDPEDGEELFTADQMREYARAALLASDDSNPNAPWLTEAHMLCTDAGIKPGHISDRIRTLREKLADGKAGGEVAAWTAVSSSGLMRGIREGKPSDEDLAIAAADGDTIRYYYTRPQQAAQVAQNNASTGRVSEFEGQMRIRWLKSLVEKQQDNNRYNFGSVEPDTGAWVGPEWVDTVHEALDDLVSAAEASKGYRFSWTRCSSCGKEFGPGDCGYSHCSDHAFTAAQVAQPLTDEEREALIEELAEWSRHVVEDTAYETLEKHVRRVLSSHGIGKDQAS